MTEVKKKDKVIGEKPTDKIEVITKKPKVKVFVIDENTDNKEYEELLDQIYTGKAERIQSSGMWVDGQYKVQVHYYEIMKEEKKRPDTDFVSTEEGKKKKSKGEEEKPEDEKKKPEDEDSELPVISPDRSEAVDFDPGLDEKKKKKK